MFKLVLLSLQVLASKQDFAPPASKETLFKNYTFTENNSCSFDPSKDIPYASLNRNFFGHNCGQCLKVTGNGKSQVVKVADSFENQVPYPRISLAQKTIHDLGLSESDKVGFFPVPCEGEKIEIKTLPCDDNHHSFVVTKSKDRVKNIVITLPDGKTETLQACNKTNIFKFNRNITIDDIIMVYSYNGGASFSQYNSTCLPRAPTFQTLEYDYTPDTTQGYITGYDTQFNANPASNSGSVDSLGQPGGISTRSNESEGASFGSDTYPECL